MKQEPNIEVGILLRKEISFYLSGIFQLENSLVPYSGECKAAIEENRMVILHNGEKRFFKNDLSFVPSDISTHHFKINNVVIGIDFHWEQEESQKFQGTLRLVIINDEIQLINIIPIEDYLNSVISSEMNALSSINLLKAHAIISRSWLLAQITKKVSKSIKNTQNIKDEYIKWFDREDHKLFHVCADDHCQRYQGISRSLHSNVLDAVRDTRGMILSCENQICDTRYSKSCGGHTETYENCWDPTVHAYLQDFPDIIKAGEPEYDLTKEKDAKDFILSTPDSFCNTRDKEILSQVLNDYDQVTADFFRWKVHYSQEEISSLIQRKSGMNFGKIISLEAIERGASGRIVKLKISGTEKELIIGKELLIRRWLSETHLYSSAIIVKTGKMINGIPESFTFYGAGWGHGVGLCQIGAAVMAEKNYDYIEILMHYYKDVGIEKYYS